MRVGGIALVFAVALVTGCSSTLESRDGARGGVGDSYMAPMRMLNLVATRGPAAVEPTQTQVRNAQTAFAAASSAVTAATTAEATARAEAEAARAALAALLPADPDAVRTTLTTAVTKETNEHVAAQATLRVAQNEFTAARANLEALVRASDASAQWRETIDVTMGPARGDPQATFVARLNDSAFRSVTGNIKITSGLLQSSEITSSGQVGEILVSTAGSLAALVTAGGRDISEGASGTRALNCATSEIVVQPVPIATGPQTVTLTFNPANPVEVRNVNYSLCRAGFSHRVFVSPPLAPRNAVVTDPTAVDERRVAESAARAEAAAVRAENAAQRTSADQEQASEAAAGAVVLQQTGEAGLRAQVQNATGVRLDSLAGARQADAPPAIICPEGVCPGLVYRQPQPWTVHVVRLSEECDPAGECSAQHFPYVQRSWSFDLPNTAPLNVLPYNTSWFVARRDTVTFVDGSLVVHDFDHPSEAARAAGIPQRMLTGFFTALSEFIELRVALVEDEESLANARRDYQTTLANPGSDEVARLQNIEQILKLELSIASLRRQLDEAETQPQPVEP